jgi:hypothetical protein
MQYSLTPSGAFAAPFGTPIDLSHPLAAKLRGWWPLSEGFGDVAHDITGRGRHGTLVNMSPASDWMVEPLVGRCLNFGGVNQYLDLPHEVIGAGDFSCAMWFRLSDYTADVGTRLICIADREDTGNSREWLIVWEGRGSKSPTDALEANLDRASNENQEIKSPANIIADNHWHHLAYTLRSNVEHKLYLDGCAVAGGSVAGDIGDITSSRYITIGCEWHNGIFDKFFSGKIADVRLWQRALSPWEVLSLATDPWAMYRQPDVPFDLLATPAGPSPYFFRTFIASRG